MEIPSILVDFLFSNWEIAVFSSAKVICCVRILLSSFVILGFSGFSSFSCILGFVCVLEKFFFCSNLRFESHQYTLPKCPVGPPTLHQRLKPNSKLSARKFKKNEIHWGQLIFHRGAKQKSCLKKKEIPQNMFLLWPKSKGQWQLLTI